MSEILNSIRLKDKLTIAGAMAAVAAVLAIAVGLVTYFTADRHTHVYDYSLVHNEDGTFDLHGLCNVENCEDPFFSETNIQGVELVSSVSPNCVKEGNKVYSYVHDGVTLTFTEKLGKTAHTYDYELVSNGDTLHINGKCNVEGCTDPFIFINDAQDLTLIEVEEATCFSPRKETYAFISGGETKTFVTLVQVNVPHTLLGVPATSYQNADKTYNWGTEGIKMLGDDSFGCGELGQGYYVCEICRQAIGVNVRRPDHKYAYSTEGLVAPTLDTTGSAFVYCQNEWCDSALEIVLPKVQKGTNAITKSTATETKREILLYTFNSDIHGFEVRLDIEVGELLSHEYEYTLSPDDEIKQQMNLIGHCSQPDCQNPDIVVENVETTFEDTSTCSKKGYWIWTHVLEDGSEVILKVQSIAFAPHSYAYDVNVDVIKPNQGLGGHISITCTECGHNSAFTLPKVVIGENATVQNEYDDYTIVEYTYVTEDGFVIKFPIIFSK